MKVLLSFIIVTIITQTASIEILHNKESRQILSEPILQRTLAVAELCSSFPNRSSLVNEQDLKDSRSMMDTVNSTIGIDGLTLFKLLANHEDSKAGRMITDNLSGIIIFGLQFTLGFVVLMFIWPFLLCCCLCTCCTGSSQYNRKTSKVLLIVLAAGLLLAVGTSIYGLIETLSVGDSIKKAGCSAAIVSDDVLYGNTTASGAQFFTGFYNINSQIGQLQDNLVDIANNFSTLMVGSSDPTMDNAFALCQTSKDDTIKISNNDVQGSPLLLTYPTPLNNQNPTGTIDSFFPGILGSYSSQTGIIWQILSSIDIFNQTLTDLRSNSQNYNNQIGNINREISSIQSSASEIITNLEDADSRIGKYLPQVQNWITISNLSVKIYYGVVICFSIVGLLAALWVGKSGKGKVIMYTSCVVLFLVASIGFTVAVGFTFALPPLTWSCSYIDDSMTDQQSFQTNFNFLLDNQTLSEISVCMPYGNGDILSKIGIDAVAGINNLTSVIADLNSFNISMYKSQIIGNFTQGLNVIDDFSESRILDIQDIPSAMVLYNLSISSSADYQACSSTLDQDSWIPSATPNTLYPYIGCQSGSGKVGNQTTCPNGIANVGDCSGCMDSAIILNFYQKNTGEDLNTDLGQRYGAGCTFNQELENVWVNYYQIKANVLGPDVAGVPSTAGVLPRTMTVKNDIDNLINEIDPALPNLFKSVLDGLSTINNIVDPKTGLLAGLNCKLMGEDFQRLEQSVCGSLYKNIYATRLALGIASYGILLSLCLFICVGRRRQIPTITSESYIQPSQETIQEPKYYAIGSYRVNPYH